MKSPRNIVFSPHVDDEVIGCFTALQRGLITDVVYFFDITPERKEEALASAAMFGFEPHFLREFDAPLSLFKDLGPEDTIFAPTIKDIHPQHAEVSIRARIMRRETNCQLMFYTVDMESIQLPLPSHIRDAKKAALAELFPSQSVLLANEKYHLFEGYTEIDHREGFKHQIGPDQFVLFRGYCVPKAPLEILWESKEKIGDYLNRLITKYYDRGQVDYIAVHNGTHWVEYNG